MTGQQLDAWVAQQVARFKPGDLDAGIEVMKRAARRRMGGQRKRPAA
ncbi:hypothetical protein SEA_RANDO14_41 [Mycobacterium phage Rando14]|uniref:Uncharacterized protein n=1 Tax=Mycobacterium phage Rando14 TaxID=2301556 RepID=A0A385D5A4_9CAUD|nr:hypothetical protein I5G75_gp55 [Mycobacterium phage Rando14]AXQ53061.1 hypothetical protein SEA_RANDO14_41 [Mycobacterium phage Rando14]